MSRTTMLFGAALGFVLAFAPACQGDERCDVDLDVGDGLEEAAELVAACVEESCPQWRDSGRAYLEGCAMGCAGGFEWCTFDPLRYDSPPGIAIDMLCDELEPPPSCMPL